jgi:ribonuclease J
MPINFNAHKNDFLFVPLGGSNEIGMNLNLYHYQGKWLMIDCGIGFNDGFIPGVDVLLPNIDMIEPIREHLVGMIITHAHEDHVGAVQYLWPEIKCPIYTTPFTAAMLKPKLSDEGLRGQVPVHEVKAGVEYTLGPFRFEMVPITHSIPEMHAVAVKTDAGTVMHTGDWKLDANPCVGVTTDEETLRRYGDEGILAMVCDSTNVFVEGESGSESDVRASLTDIIRECEQRVVITTFASNIARLETVIRAAIAAGREVALAGKSLWRVTQAAKESGYLLDLPPFLTDSQGMDKPRDRVVFICTGCQGESRAALSKVARGDHPAIRLSKGDTVIFSSRTIPGNEPQIGWVQNRLVEQGLELITDYNGFVHVSGHPARMELERMYALVRPKIAIPVHGERRHIHEHAKLAKSLQVPETVEPQNGSVVLLKEGDARVIGFTESGYLALDGTSMLDTNSPVLKTRRKIRDDGFMVASFALNKSGALISDIVLSAPGILDAADDKDLLESIAEEIAEVISKANPKSKRSLPESVRSVMRRTINDELGKKPVLDVHIHQLK